MESTEPTERTDEEQLQRIEALLLKVQHQLEDEACRRRAWSVFWQLVALHSLAATACLHMQDALDGIVLYGCFVGSASTICIWHGLSLRTFAQRWQRTIFAVTAYLVATAFLSEDLDLDELLTAFAVYCILFGAACICVSHFIRILMQVGLRAPDSPSLRPRGTSLSSLFMLATIAALMLTASRVIAWWYTDAGVLGHVGLLVFALYGAGLAAILSLGLLSWVRRQWLGMRMLILLAVCGTTCLFNITMLNSWALLQGEALGVWSFSDFVTLLPYCVLFTLAQLALPVVTIAVLFRSGHRIEVVSRHN